MLAEHQLSLGSSAIVDAVSSIEIARDMWRRAAHRAAAELRIIEVVRSDRPTHRRRLSRRRRNIDGFPEPSWRSLGSNLADARAFLLGWAARGG